MISGGLVAWVGWLVSQVAVAPVGVGNALTLPAQRHLLRMEASADRPARWWLALQQDGAEGRGLSLFTRVDEAQGFRFEQPIQPDISHRDTADVEAVGRDLALVYGFEGPKLTGSRRHDVFFQWWREKGPERWKPSAPVKVFDSTSDASAYSRPELAIDSRGRIWVQAFRLERDGGSSLMVSVSEDGGEHFSSAWRLARLPKRGGGRLLHLGDRLLMLYGMHDGGVPAKLRLHSDASTVKAWSPERRAFSSGEGIYHGAALSAVADAQGGAHLVYKREADQHLLYRHFDGEVFGPAIEVDADPDWALQSATTRVGDRLAIFYNHVLAPGSHFELRVRWLKAGILSAPETLDASKSWKGYLAAPPALPATIESVPCLFGDVPDQQGPGRVSEVAVPNPASRSARAGDPPKHP